MLGDEQLVGLRQLEVDQLSHSQKGVQVSQSECHEALQGLVVVEAAAETAVEVVLDAVRDPRELVRVRLEEQLKSLVNYEDLDSSREILCFEMAAGLCEALWAPPYSFLVMVLG